MAAHSSGELVDLFQSSIIAHAVLTEAHVCSSLRGLEATNKHRGPSKG